MYCSNCGAEILANAAFCGSCGKRVSQSVGAVSPVRRPAIITALAVSQFAYVTSKRVTTRWVPINAAVS